MEAFGDGVVGDEALHGGNFLAQGIEGLAVPEQQRQAEVAELADRLEKAASEAAALGAGLIPGEQLVAEVLLQAVDELEDGMLGQVLVDALLSSGLKRRRCRAAGSTGCGSCWGAVQRLWPHSPHAKDVVD